jgi:hypothetical protein
MWRLYFQKNNSCLCMKYKSTQSGKNVVDVIKVVSKENAVWQFRRGIVPLKFLRKSLTTNQNQM